MRLIASPHLSVEDVEYSKCRYDVFGQRDLKILESAMGNALETLELLDFYGKKFQKIRVDRAHGVAPHKPILLLSVIEHIQKHRIQENKIFLQPQLIHTFLKYWLYLGSNTHNPDISKPFFFMKSGKFWHLWPNGQFESVLSSNVKLKTFAEVKRVIKYAYLDEDLFELLQQPIPRENLLRVLVSKWFPGQIDNILDISAIDKLDNTESKLLEKYARFYAQDDVGPILKTVLS